MFVQFSKISKLHKNKLKQFKIFGLTGTFLVKKWKNVRISVKNEKKILGKIGLSTLQNIKLKIIFSDFMCALYNFCFHIK